MSKAYSYRKCWVRADGTKVEKVYSQVIDREDYDDENKEAIANIIAEFKKLTPHNMRVLTRDLNAIKRQSEPCFVKQNRAGEI